MVPRQAEVNDLDDAILVHHDIRWLQVAMQHTMFLEMCQTCEQLFHYTLDVGYLKHDLLLQYGFKVVFGELKDQVLHKAVRHLSHAWLRTLLQPIIIGILLRLSCFDGCLKHGLVDNFDELDNVGVWRHLLQY